MGEMIQLPSSPADMQSSYGDGSGDHPGTHYGSGYLVGYGWSPSHDGGGFGTEAGLTEGDGYGTLGYRDVVTR